MSSGSTTDPETQPLLNHSKPHVYHGELTQDASRAADGSDEASNDALVPDDPNTPRTRSWATIAFRSVIVLLLFTVVGLLIERFVDADDVEFDFGNALRSALGGGISGAAAMVLQVLMLMPLRTVMNYQYRYGTTTTEAIQTLYADGGWTRYYQGLVAALVLAVLARFGNTAANAGMLALLESNASTNRLPVLVKTLFASVIGACFRMLLTPIDTIKTAMQTQGKNGIPLLRARVRMYGIGSLWYGALVSAIASFASNYPWFGTFNYLDATLPLPATVPEKLLRSAVIGFVASVLADIISNSLFVVKTYRQVHATRIGYADAARAVIAADGIQGLLGRGLKMRILTDGVQGVLFSVLWRLFLDAWNDKAGRPDCHR